ncbi:hypothetical protein [Thermococcus sp.]|uniref:hypothetical protein n=1 Tax=Thermococcus sp. TaxID=35749 RepID=UPI0025E34960|nr:hypothetical protein [Thermococcus sp.]
MTAEANFWSWVSGEKAKLKPLEQAGEPPTILEWLERKVQVARNAAFSATVQRKNGAEYWTGYADALEDLLRKIERREVRA